MKIWSKQQPWRCVQTDSLEDELGIRRAEPVQALLDHVVAVEILDKLDHVGAQGSFDDVDLLLGAKVLDHFLECSRAMLIQGDVDHLGAVNVGFPGSGAFDARRALVIVAELHKLVDEIVAEGIFHQVDDMADRLEPDHMYVFWIAQLKLLLQIATAMLILAELENATASGRKKRHSCRSHPRYPSVVGFGSHEPGCLAAGVEQAGKSGYSWHN